MICFNFLFCLALSPLAASMVNETNLAEITGSDISTLPDANWTDWLSANPQAPENTTIEVECELDKGNRSYGDCCNSSSQCDQSKLLVCMQQQCYCRPGLYPSADNTTCVDRPKKELGESCSPTKDNCVIAFTTCVNGKCVCREGFREITDQLSHRCKATDFYCPYKEPLMVNGSQWTCNINGNGHSCPDGYWCVLPVDGPRPKYFKIFSIGNGKNLTVENSYCCPLVKYFKATSGTPDAANADAVGSPKVYDDVCIHGKPFDTSEKSCPLDTHYWFPGIGEGPVCCPAPCLNHPVAKPVILNGKCTFEQVNRE